MQHPNRRQSFRPIRRPARCRRALVASLPALVALAAVGCGRASYDLAPVSGRVTLGGNPLAGVSVSFVPLAADKTNPNVGPGSLGKTDADGQFTLRTVNAEPGAVPAEHVVRITSSATTQAANDPDGVGVNSGRSGPALPRSARDGTIRFRVPPEGTDQANFDLATR